MPVDRRALRLYRRNFWTIFFVSAVVFAPLSLFAAITNQRAADWVDDPGNGALLGSLAFAASALMLFGYALCAGLLDKLVVGPEFGHPKESIRQALRTLPYAQLVGLDLLTTVGVIVGLVLGVVPGLVLFTFAALAPPLMVSEHRGVLSSLRRSGSLVRHAFVITFLVVTLPVFVEHEIFGAIELLVDFPLVVLWALHLLASVFVLALIVVCETTLAFTLVDEERNATESTAVDAPAA
jgi:hypothetical protein